MPVYSQMIAAFKSGLKTAQVFVAAHEAQLALVSSAFQRLCRHVSRSDSLFFVSLCNLSQDKNLGLAKQALQALVRHSIRRLTDTYVSVSLAEIGAAVGLSGPAEAMAKVTQMVC